MKFAVYTIALNEEQFTKRWLESTKDADYRLVVDTGSTDRTESILVIAGVRVQHISVKPWRFDDARNAALAMIPDDIDVVISLDMDEILVPNWRELIERAWTPITTRLHYQYVWSWKDGLPDVIFYSDKIAGRHTHRWRLPIHETLTPTVPETISFCEQVLIEHHPDDTKSRGQYLPLLRLAVQENPNDDRSSHYLGREYYFHHLFIEAIAEFERHLSLPSAAWAAERCASMRYVAKCYEALQEPEKARIWYTKATLEDTASKEALVDLARFHLHNNEYYAAIAVSERAMALPSVTGSYMNERYALQEGPYDLAAVALHNIGEREKAIRYAAKAVKLNPKDKRLDANLSAMQTQLILTR